MSIKITQPIGNQDLTIDNLIQLALDNNLKFEAYTSMWTYIQVRGEIIDTQIGKDFETTFVGIELKPGVYYWWRQYRGSTYLNFEYRYNCRNGAKQRTTRQEMWAESFIQTGDPKSCPVQW